MNGHCFDLLLDAGSLVELPGVVLAVGDDPFLRTETTNALLPLAGIDSEQVRKFDGDECTWATVQDELASFSLFEPEARRVVVVSSADRLIKDARPQLEKWCESPAEGSLLILQVTTLASNTRLYKLAGQHGWIFSCGLPVVGSRKEPDLAKIKDWVGKWASARHSLKLKTSQAALILDAVGPQCGLLHQELAKLALFADSSGNISDDLVRTHVGSWATRTTWDIADAIMDGRIAHALDQLDRLFTGGESALAVVPQIAWSLRRYGHAAQLVLQSRRMGKPIDADQAVKLAGFWGNDLRLAPNRLRRIGLPRASKILAWLLELDLKLKLSHSSPSRSVFAVEEFCMRFV